MRSTIESQPDLLDTATLPSQLARPRVLFVNRSYWPCTLATGQLLTELCEDLSAHFEVHVICGRPRANYQHEDYVKRGLQVRNGVHIHRVRDPEFQWGGMATRALGMAAFLGSSSFKALRVPRPDIVVTETDPPLLCLLGGMARRFRRARHICYLQDIYPDVAEAVGVLRSPLLVGFVRRLFLGTYNKADRVVVLSDDMQSALFRTGVPLDKTSVIHNWVDTAEVTPIKQNNKFRHVHELENKFVVMYSGNMGLTQRLTDIVDAANILADHQEIVFAMVGHGSQLASLKNEVRQRDLKNVRFFNFQPKSELSQSLSAADLQLVLLDDAVKDYLMPSKFYGILASGTPSLAVAPQESELARLCLNKGIGLVVPSGEPQQMADAIHGAWLSNGKLNEMGNRARDLSGQFDRNVATTRFADVLREALVARR